MAYSEQLAERIHQALDEKKVDYFAKKMMGGLTFMVDNKMCVGIIKETLMARIGIDAYEDALTKKGCLPMDFTGRPMKGYVFIAPEGIDFDEDLEYWIQLALDFNPLAKASKKRKKKKSMKNIITLLFIFQMATLQAQLFPLLPKDTDTVEKTITRNYGRKGSIRFKQTHLKYFYFSQLYSGWKTIKTYDDNGELIIQTNKYRNRVMAKDIHKVSSNTNIVYHSVIDIANINNNICNASKIEFVYNSDQKIKTINTRIFCDDDTIQREPYIRITNIKYLNNQISSYQRNDYIYNYQYNDNNQLIAIEESTNGFHYGVDDSLSTKTGIVEKRVFDGQNHLKRKWLFSYDELGRLKTYRTDNCNKQRKGVNLEVSGGSYTDFYKYDKKGNWKKRYRKYDGSNRRLAAKRRIKYVRSE